MAEFFVADMHFGSRSNAKARGFASADEMDETISRAWRSRVAAHDGVWVLGDVGNLATLAALPGVKHLIYGNNDTPKARFIESQIFQSLANSHVFPSPAGSMLLVHRPQDAKLPGIPVVHGHTHSGRPQANPLFVSVSVDKTEWGPISLKEVWSRIAARMATSA